MGATTNPGSKRHLWTRVVRPTILLGGLGMLVVFWLTLMLSDTAISPIAFIDVPYGVFVTIATLHVASALAGWLVATISAFAARRVSQILFAMVVVPLTALVTLLVMMTDATVWHGQLGSWIAPMLLAMSGPVALGVLLVWALVGALSTARATVATDGLAPPTPTDAVQGSRTSDASDHAPARRSRGRRIAGAITAVVVVVVLALGVLIGSSETWEWVDGGRSLVTRGDVLAVAVTAGGPGFVAVGEISGPSRQLTVWTSPDGRSWSRVPGDDAFGLPGERIAVHDVVATPELIIAAGAVTSGMGDNSQPSPAVWTSPDGRTWERSWVGDETGVVHSVAAAGSTMAAVGSDGDAAAAWISTNAIAWERIDSSAFRPDLPQVGDGPVPTMSLEAITAGGPGFVAVGVTARFEQADRRYNGADIRAVVFTSPDGAEWTRVPHDEATFGGIERHTMKSVIQGGPGLVAVGSRLPRGPVAWTSADGLTWRRHSIDASNVQDVGLSDVARIEYPSRAAGTLVAVGQDWGPFTGSRRDVVPVLVSRDGVRWARDTSRVFTTGRSHQVVLNGVAASDRGVVALGTVMGASWDGVDATVWFAPTADRDN